jgi:hypothetical protein
MDTTENRIEVTVVRNDREQNDVVNGLYVPKALPHYDVKKIVGAVDVRLQDESGIKAFLVGSNVSHDQLAAINADKAYKLVVLDNPARTAPAN